MNRGKNVIASQDVDLRRYWSRAPFRVALEGQLLSAHLAESEIIIRLGAIANGILAVGRSLRPVDDLRSLRDRMQATTLFASHVKEAAKILNHRHGGLGWTLAAEGVRGGHHLASSHLQTLQLLLDDEAAFLQTCNRIRDDFGFHIGPEPVKRWLDDSQRSETIVLQTADATVGDGWMFDASSQVLYDAIPSEARSKDFIDQLFFFARTFPMLVGAMITGFCCRYGVELSVMDGIEGNEVSLLPAPTSDGGVAIEIRPARMVWAPFFVGIPAEDAADLSPRLCIAMPEGPLEDIGVIPTRDYPGWWVRLSKVPVSSEGNKICLVCKKTPGPLVLGQIGGPRYRVVLSRDWRPRAGANPLEPPDVTG